MTTKKNHRRLNLALLGAALAISALAYRGSASVSTNAQVAEMRVEQERFLIPKADLHRKVVSSSNWEYYCGPHYYGPVGSGNGGWHHPSISPRFRGLDSKNGVESALRKALLVAKDA